MVAEEGVDDEADVEAMEPPPPHLHLTLLSGS